MLRAAITILILGATACGSGSPSNDEATRCQRMVDHLIDLRLEGLDPDVAERHRALLEDSVAPRTLESCASADPGYVQCVLDATEPGAISACDAKGGQS